LPPAIYVVLRTVEALVQSSSITKSEYMKGVIIQQSSSQIPSSNGSFEAPANHDVVVLLLGTRVNHPLGALAPGAVKMTLYFNAMMTELNDNPSDYGVLGVSSSWFEADRQTCNNLLTVFYFESIEGLHKFANGPLHRDALIWYHKTVKEYPHISIWHETFHSPAGHWETVYGGCAPTLMGRATFDVEVAKDNGEKETKWLSPLVDASRGLLKSANGRMGGKLQRSNWSTVTRSTKMNIL
jgi:hypothetical protein